MSLFGSKKVRGDQVFRLVEARKEMTEADWDSNPDKPLPARYQRAAASLAAAARNATEAERLAAQETARRLGY